MDGFVSFKSTYYGTEYKVNVQYNCKSTGIVYCMECKHCGAQYIGSTICECRKRLNQHRSQIARNSSEGCRVVPHLNGECNVNGKPQENYRIYIIDHVEDLGNTKEELQFADKQLNKKERYWQGQLGTVFNGMNGTKDWYNISENRRNWQKETRDCDLLTDSE